LEIQCHVPTKQTAALTGGCFDVKAFFENTASKTFKRQLCPYAAFHCFC
jgi:benzoyl-CoA reductase/2-hydroxyglutaryl-CoA dehydratase subunit BcrC/BadD/HgdB